MGNLQDNNNNILGNNNNIAIRGSGQAGFGMRAPYRTAVEVVSLKSRHRAAAISYPRVLFLDTGSRGSRSGSKWSRVARGRRRAPGEPPSTLRAPLRSVPPPPNARARTRRLNFCRGAAAKQSWRKQSWRRTVARRSAVATMPSGMTAEAALPDGWPALRVQHLTGERRVRDGRVQAC